MPDTSRAPELHQVVLLLGSNIEKEKNLPAALSLLVRSVAVVDLSSVYESRPSGSRDQPNFFNAAVLVSSSQEPADLKDGLIADIEALLHRVRTTDKYSPRTIDLDIVLYGDETRDYTPRDGRTRHIPDPDLLKFAHVALPVAELLPRTLHPETGESMTKIAARLRRKAKSRQDATIWVRPDIDLRPLLEDDKATG
ncbi:MAG TPA: 2-amino-4-hydroxy-6-hydroxymethyldihydropteridine diphosphokinase [Promineifilum sp.]